MIRTLAAHLCRLLAAPFGLYIDHHAARLRDLDDKDWTL